MYLDMMIKPGHPQVNPNGIVSMPYSAQWNPNTHTLVELVAHACSLFGQIPPVFRRPAQLPFQNDFQPNPRHLRPPTRAFSNPHPQPTSNYTRPPTSHTPYTHATPTLTPRQKHRKELTVLLQQDLRLVLTRLCKETDEAYVIQKELLERKALITHGVKEMESQEEELTRNVKSAQEQSEVVVLWLKTHQESQEVNNHCLFVFLVHHLL